MEINQFVVLQWICKQFILKMYFEGFFCCCCFFYCPLHLPPILLYIVLFFLDVGGASSQKLGSWAHRGKV